MNRLTEQTRAGGAGAQAGEAQASAAERQYEVLFETTTQLLAAPNVEERMLLTLDAVTSGLGYTHAAIALIDKRKAALQLRMAVGFEDDGALAGLELPLDSSGPHVAVVHHGHPAWVTRRDGEPAAAAFLDRLGCRDTDLLALPLFGGPPGAEHAEGEFARRPYDDDRYWMPAAMCTGALYVGARQAEVGEGEYRLLARLADRVGVIISAAVQLEQMNATVRKLQRERQWVESVMQSVADPIVLTNLDNEILLQNRRAEELFSGQRGASPGKRRALEMNDLLFSAYLSSAAFASKEVVARDLTLVDPIDGSDIHFEVISTPALDARGERIGLVSVFRDVTDLRHANEELARNFAKLQQAELEARRERDRLDLILENVGHPVAVSDPQGNFILFNKRAERLFQQAAEMSARSSRAVLANAVKLTSFISTLASSAALTGRQAEIELLDPETGVTLPMEITSAEVTDARGQVTAVVSILHDLTEIRELERRRVEQQLFESEKLAAVGRLAASIAHEVNNPLEAIKNSLYLLTTSQNEQSNSRFLDVARRETERVSHIIRQMLGFARRSGEVEPVDVNQLLEETLVLVEKKLKQSRVRVVREFNAALPRVRARADQLRQVFLNLVLNAQQAIEGEGEVRIRTTVYNQALQPSVSVQISDTGRGISEQDVARIFEPFFSTRAKGTGLGLWVSQDIVRHHGGRIEVTSAEGSGTTFHIILPVDSPTLTDDSEPQSQL